MRGLALLLAVLALSACDDAPEDDAAALPPVGERLVALQEAQCRDDGGRWGRTPSGSGYVCYRDTRDGNQSCLRATDCEGVCLARSRTCAPVTPYFGCHEVLTAGGVRATVCTE